MATRKKTASKKPTKVNALTMPSMDDVEKARVQSKSSEVRCDPGHVFGLDYTQWVPYLVCAASDEATIAKNRARMTAKGWIELPDGPHSVSPPYHMGAYVFVMPCADFESRRRARGEKLAEK
jgi:hypothetical protein|tara:strand:+ start:25 stop:390 length:366 start_codon:yes stop_codon:yes gene_type:complete